MAPHWPHRGRKGPGEDRKRWTSPACPCPPSNTFFVSLGISPVWLGKNCSQRLVYDKKEEMDTLGNRRILNPYPSALPQKATWLNSYQLLLLPTWQNVNCLFLSDSRLYQAKILPCLLSMETWRQKAYLETIEWAGRTWIWEPGRLNAGDKLLTSLSTSNPKKASQLPSQWVHGMHFLKGLFIFSLCRCCMFCLSVCVHPTCMSGLLWSRKSASGFLELELQDSSVGDGNWTHILCRSNRCT